MSRTQGDRAVERLARRQHGVFTRAQIIDAGLTDRVIARRLANGTWVKLSAGVYASAAAPPTWRRQVKAAQLGLANSVVSHRAAAALHGIAGCREGAIDLTVPTSGPSRSSFAVVHRRSRTPTTTIDGIRVTTLPRTVVDLAAQLPVSRLAAVFDDLVVARRLRVDDVRAEYEALTATRCRGIGAVRWLLDDRVDGRLPAANELERALRRVLEDPSFPPVEHQAALPWRASAPQRVDALVPAWRRIVEADGRRWHTREADFERDRARDHEAQRHGYEVTRFTYRQLVGAPDYARAVLRDIARAA